MQEYKNYNVFLGLVWSGVAWSGSMDIIHGYHPLIISIDITHGIPWGVPWDPRGGTMGTPWVGSLSLLGLMGPLGLIGPLGLMGPQGLMGPGPWALGHGPRLSWRRLAALWPAPGGFCLDFLLSLFKILSAPRPRRGGPVIRGAGEAWAGPN